MFDSHRVCLINGRLTLCSKQTNFIGTSRFRSITTRSHSSHTYLDAEWMLCSRGISLIRLHVCSRFGSSNLLHFNEVLRLCLLNDLPELAPYACSPFEFVDQFKKLIPHPIVSFIVFVLVLVLVVHLSIGSKYPLDDQRLTLQ